MATRKKAARKKAAKRRSAAPQPSTPDAAVESPGVPATPDPAERSEIGELKELLSLLHRIKRDLLARGVGVPPGEDNPYARWDETDRFYDDHEEVVASEAREARRCEQLLDRYIWTRGQIPRSPEEASRRRLRDSIDWLRPLTIDDAIEWVSEQLDATGLAGSEEQGRVLDDKRASALLSLIPVSVDGRRRVSGRDLLALLHGAGHPMSESAVKRLLARLKKACPEIKSTTGRRGGYWRTSDRPTAPR
jgi:hypothetical protein